MVSYCSEFPIVKMAKVLSLPKSSYYSKKKRLSIITDKDRRDAKASVAVKTVFDNSKRIYGSPKITTELKKRGLKINHKKVEKIMRNQGLYSITKRKFKVTTNSKNTIFAAPDLVKREFKPLAPNKIWVSDITYIQTKSGWSYLCVFIDLFSRAVVGWSVANNMKVEMVQKALNDAILTRKPDKGLIIHTDRGSQYNSNSYKQLVEDNGFKRSMSRRGNCWDNAVAESFFSILKKELIFHIKELYSFNIRQILFEYIEIFYNRQRMHSNNNFLTPLEKELNYIKKCA